MRAGGPLVHRAGGLRGFRVRVQIPTLGLGFKSKRIDNPDKEKTISKLCDLNNWAPATKPFTKFTFFTKVIQNTTKVKYKVSRLKQQLGLIFTTLLEGVKMKGTEKPET
ncbi:hypothetical protein DSO57_1009948 [Entomophthora muscae]|uniref:Uncharacterized protein n=1 Tax=Entomophthora muscae TaxID=34485 RepID=A0ACC2UFJ2_9FUNG|nr:hypothetical protein DSO57_1009948 [Entomophthora muscae]